MMDWSAHNAGFVALSYVLSGIGLAGLAVVVLLRERRASQNVKNLKD